MEYPQAGREPDTGNLTGTSRRSSFTNPAQTDLELGGDIKWRIRPSATAFLFQDDVAIRLDYRFCAWGKNASADQVIHR